jgi:hypothetical protein
MANLAELLSPLMAQETNVYSDVIVVLPDGSQYMARRFYVEDEKTLHLVCELDESDYDARTQVGSSSIEVDE